MSRALIYKVHNRFVIGDSVLGDVSPLHFDIVSVSGLVRELIITFTTMFNYESVRFACTIKWMNEGNSFDPAQVVSLAVT